jgi:hypothetical protein
MGLLLSGKTCFTEKSFHRVGAGVRRRGSQPGEREVREAACDSRAQPLEDLTLIVVQAAQLFSEHAVDFFGGNLFERAAKVGELTPNCACRKVAAQARQTLVDSSPDGGKAHELGEPLFLGCLNEVIHADARQTGELRVFGINVGWDAEIDYQRRAGGGEREFRQHTHVEDWLATTGGQHEGADVLRARTEFLQRKRLAVHGWREFFGSLEGAVYNQEGHSGAMQRPSTALGHR